MTSLITAHNLTKTYGHLNAIDHIDFSIKSGQIYGLIGPNGAGKTTLLKAILGLTPYSGTLEVMGMRPRYSRRQLMNHLCFIADVAVLPRWINALEALSFVEGVHPKFNRTKALHFLSKTDIPLNKPVSALSKGMIVQLHLALVMAIDVRLLILDEPTLGLDILYRKQFYKNLLNDYFNEQRTIIVTTHQIEEIESILTHIMMINKGRLLVDASMETIQKRFIQVTSDPTHKDQLDALHPISQEQKLGLISYLYDGVPESTLASLGKLSTPSISDIFTALVLGDPS